MHEPNLFKSHVVYTKQLWADPWSLRPYLRSPQCTFACGPDMSSAVLEYKYGNIHRSDANDYAVFAPLDLSDRYVKIEIDDGPTWYGVVVDQQNERGGEHEVNGVEVVRGTQTFICRGLEFLLHRKIIDRSQVERLADELEIFRAIGFNLGAGQPGSSDKIANRSVGVGAKGGHLFSRDLEFAREWTASDILEYLVAYHVPTDLNGVDSLGWFANRFDYKDLLEGHTPTLQAHGKTFFQVLNELIDRRRLLGWYVYVNPANEHPEIRVFSFNRNWVHFEDGNSIPPNRNQIADWDFDQNNLVQQFVLSTDDATRYDRVYARGEPIGGCFTASIVNGLLEPDWSSAQQTAYNAGATGSAGYAALDSWAKHDANQQARSKDALKKVYRYFRVPTTFDGYVVNNPIWPIFPGSGVTLPFWRQGLRFQDRLPLRTEHDYSTVAAVTNAMKTGSKWEYQRPFVFVQETGGRAYFIDRITRGKVDDDMESGGRQWAASVRMQDDGFGIIVDAPIAHLIAKNTWTAADDDDETDHLASVDYNYMSATVFAEADRFAQAVWPQNVLNVDYVKDLIINVPNARLDYIVPGTVIDIDDDGAPITTTGGYVRDDTAYLKNVARSAFEWYSDPRKSISVTIRDLAETRVRGELLLAVGGNNNAETINSVVTNATYNMRAGTATYVTQFAELDPR